MVIDKLAMLLLDHLLQAFENETVVQVSCGGSHTLVLLQDGRLFAMGDNTHGQIGVAIDASAESKFVEAPVHVASFNSSVKLAQIASGDEFSLALTDSGEVYSWGRGQYGQLGLGEEQVGPLDTPTKIPNLPKIKKVFTGPNQVFAIEYTNGTSLKVCGSAGRIGRTHLLWLVRGVLVVATETLPPPVHAVKAPGGAAAAATKKSPKAAGKRGSAPAGKKGKATASTKKARK